MPRAGDMVVSKAEKVSALTRGERNGEQANNYTCNIMQSVGRTTKKNQMQEAAIVEAPQAEGLGG